MDWYRPVILDLGLIELELSNVCGWLANCDEVMETKDVFLVVTEHRLVSARARSEVRVGLLPVRTVSMLDMLGLVWLV